MITDVQQYRIHNGDKEAFYTFCRENGLHVYRRALEALHDESAAKSVASDVLRQFRAEILSANNPFPDAEARLDALTDALLKKASAHRTQPKTTHRKAPAFPYPLKDVLPEQLIFQSTDEIRYDDTAYRPRSKWYPLLTAFAALLIIALLWFALAALIRAGVLPFIDVGYTWFNAHVYDLFHFLT